MGNKWFLYLWTTFQSLFNALVSGQAQWKDLLFLFSYVRSLEELQENT